MSRLPFIIGTVSVVLAAIGSIATAIFLVVSIERRTIEAVQATMDEAGTDWVQISANGLQVFLEGTAPSEAAHFNTLSRVGGLVDPDRVVNRMEVARQEDLAPPRFSVDMLRNGDGIQLIGLVPGAMGTDAVTEALAQISDGVEVTNLVETADFPVPGTWEDALDYGLRALLELPRSKVTVYEDRVEVQAISASVNERAQFLATLQRGQPRGVQVVLDISAPRPVITPYALRFVIDAEGARFETCAADTLEARDQIVDAAEAAGAEGLLVCQIGLGVPSPQWADAASAAIAALADLGAGTVDFSDADVTMIAVEGTTQPDFDRVIGELSAALPDVFSLEGVLPELPEANPDEAAVAAQLLATLQEDGAISLRGRLPEGPVGQSVQAYARAVFGQENTDVATREVPDLPQGWAVRAMAGLDALSTLNDGVMTLEPDVLRLEGRTGNPDATSDLTRMLTEALGATASYELNVAYVEALDPVASQPSPEECVARIAAIQDETKITFEPGSITITDEAGEILDQIAEILPDCRHVRMEISGHTDSQGRETMNLNLSQSRAEAVLNGLLARNVLVSNLTAQGYGEAQPIAENDTEDGRERNRRIEFRLLSTAVEGDGADADGTGEATEDTDDAAPETDEDTTVPETRPAPRPDSVVEAAQEAREEE